MHYIRALANNRFIHNKGEEGEGRGGRRNIGDMVRREEGGKKKLEEGLGGRGVRNHMALSWDLKALT